MNPGNRHSTVANKPLLVLAAVLLIVPIVALMWVSSYARIEPVVAGFPFFIWYQFVWVFLCSLCTAAAFRLVRIARQGTKGDGQ